MKSRVDQLQSDGDLQRLQDEASTADKRGYSFCSLMEKEEKVVSENDQQEGKNKALLGIVFIVALKNQEEKKNKTKPTQNLKPHFMNNTSHREFSNLH